MQLAVCAFGSCKETGNQTEETCNTDEFVVEQVSLAPVWYSIRPELILWLGQIPNSPSVGCARGLVDELGFEEAGLHKGR